MQWRVFDDRPFEFLLKIVKKDAQTGKMCIRDREYREWIRNYIDKKYEERGLPYPTGADFD